MANLRSDPKLGPHLVPSNPTFWDPNNYPLISGSKSKIDPSKSTTLGLMKKVFGEYMTPDILEASGLEESSILDKEYVPPEIEPEKKFKYVPTKEELERMRNLEQLKYFEDDVQDQIDEWVDGWGQENLNLKEGWTPDSSYSVLYPFSSSKS